MQSPAEPLDPDQLSAPPLNPAASALFLDLDGTLAEICPHPDDVGPDRARTELLRDLLRVLDGRLAVVSGRSLADLDRILEGVVPAIAAVHGLDIREADGRLSRQTPAPALDEARRVMLRLAEAQPGVLIEDKGLALACHYRAAPEARERVEAAAADLAQRLDLSVQPGHAVVELRTPGADKGSAIARLMQTPPFIGHTPVFVGDDLTDEAGFATVNTLGGLSIRVGVPETPSLAPHRLANPGAVAGWLRAALG